MSDQAQKPETLPAFIGRRASEVESEIGQAKRKRQQLLDQIADIDKSLAMLTGGLGALRELQAHQSSITAQRKRRKRK